MEEKQIKNSSSKYSGEDGYGDMGAVAIHSQVIKIKQELEILKRPSLKQAEEMRRAIYKFSRERSRSPLGLAERPISVGN